MKFMTLQKTCRDLVLAVGVLLFVGSHLYAQQAVPIVAPPDANGIFDGNSYATPFDTAGRFQQVYDSSVFSSSPWLPEGRGFIGQLILRVDANFGHSFHSTLPSVQLNLSTTLKSADGLSSTFADNVGSDDVAVLGPEPILFSVLGGGGIASFGVLFDFRDNPFYYDSSQGNLLVDFRIHEGFNPPGPTLGEAILDSFTAPGDPISSVYAQGSSSLTSGQISTLGLATLFPTSPIPEPSSLALMSLGCLFACGLAWRRRRHQKEKPHVIA